jgi:hypothetical protein
MSVCDTALGVDHVFPALGRSTPAEPTTSGESLIDSGRDGRRR